MPRERDPFPFPRYENDYTFTGSKQTQVVYQYKLVKVFKIANFSKGYSTCSSIICLFKHNSMEYLIKMFPAFF